jgi:hypothetical protein
MSTNAAEGRRRVVVAPSLDDRNSVSTMRFLTVSGTSVLIHIGLILLFCYLPFGDAQASPIVPDGGIKKDKDAQDVEPPEPDLDLSNMNMGDPSEDNDTNYDVDRTNEQFSTPGEVNPDAPVGIPGGPADAPKVDVPPPPGTGGGTGLAPPGPDSGIGQNIGTAGGMGGIFHAGGIGGRSGGTKKKLLQAGGGNAASEAAVAHGLHWLALHQASDGHWSLHEFNRHARTEPFPRGKVIRCNCGGMSGRHNDTAATGFGLLPFLGAGFTHRGGNRQDPKHDYTKTVKAGLDWLLKKQDKKGYYGGDMYSHGIATIAVCEAYGLTSDNVLKVSAQKALNYIVNAQDPAGGGWRYTPRTAGDTSVTGRQLMALKSGQMSGLSVPRKVMDRAGQFLDSCESRKKGGYGYVPGNGETITMTAVGLLCRQYLGIGPRNPALNAGVQRIKGSPPKANRNMYYLYYATQVMHHMGGEDWEFWNEGNPKGTGIRDMLIGLQYHDATGRFQHLVGSWDPAPLGCGAGGRMMSTSLALLTLEVYYRHLPLYRREMAVNNKNAN